LAASTKERDARKLAAFFSADFHSPGGNSRDAFCEAAVEHLRRLNVEEVIVWDFRFGEVSRSSRKGTVRFRVKVKGALTAEADCEAELQLDPDNQWRVKGFKVFYPPSTTKEYRIPL
jgi:hypothetical protein